MRSWYCAQTYPGNEEQTRQQLAMQGINETFQPNYLIRDKHKHIIRRCLFRGYLFVSLDDPIQWPIVHRTHGVQRMIIYRPSGSDYDSPCPIDASAIERLRSLALTYDEIRRNGKPSLPIQYITEGCFVRVKNGIFAGEQYAQRALVTWTEGDRAKLRMLMFNREAEIEFYMRDLQLVEQANA